MTLREMSRGHKALVVAVTAAEKERRRLESIGLIPGTELSVMAENGSQILVAVGEARVAVERDLAAFVAVV